MTTTLFSGVGGVGRIVLIKRYPVGVSRACWAGGTCGELLPLVLRLHRLCPVTVERGEEVVVLCSLAVSPPGQRQTSHRARRHSNAPLSDYMTLLIDR